MSKLDTDDFEETKDLAMAHLSEAVRLAKITLEDGRVLQLDARDVIGVCTNLARQSLKKQRPVTAPEDFNLKESDSEKTED